MPPAPRIFPGYTVAAASTVAFIATAPGQTMLVSQLNLPLREAFGINELTLNASYTIATVLASFPLVLVGALTDRFGPRRIIALIALVYGLGCLVMAGAQGFVTVFLAFFLLRFLGQGALALASQHAVAMWFHRKLGRVHGVKQVIVFGVWSVFPPVSLLLIESLGWRWTYALFALLIWVTVIPVSLIFVRNKPEDLGLNMDNDPADPAADPSFTTPPDPTSVGPNPPARASNPASPPSPSSKPRGREPTGRSARPSSSRRSSARASFSTCNRSSRSGGLAPAPRPPPSASGRSPWRPWPCPGACWSTGSGPRP